MWTLNIDLNKPLPLSHSPKWSVLSLKKYLYLIVKCLCLIVGMFHKGESVWHKKRLTKFRTKWRSIFNHFCKRINKSCTLIGHNYDVHSNAFSIGHILAMLETHFVGSVSAFSKECILYSSFSEVKLRIHKFESYFAFSFWFSLYCASLANSSINSPNTSCSFGECFKARSMNVVTSTLWMDLVEVA